MMWKRRKRTITEWEEHEENQSASVKMKLSTGRPCPLSPHININYRDMLSSLSVLQPFLIATASETMTLHLDSLIPSCASVSQLGGWIDGWKNDRMNRWPVCWRREGRGGLRELQLEMEKKNKGNINLAQRSLFLSLSRYIQHMYSLRGSGTPCWPTLCRGHQDHWASSNWKESRAESSRSPP